MLSSFRNMLRKFANAVSASSKSLPTPTPSPKDAPASPKCRCGERADVPMPNGEWKCLKCLATREQLASAASALPEKQPSADKDHRDLPAAAIAEAAVRRRPAAAAVAPPAPASAPPATAVRHPRVSATSPPQRHRAEHRDEPKVTVIRRELRRSPCNDCLENPPTVQQRTQKCGTCHGKLWILNPSPPAGVDREMLCPACEGTGEVTIRKVSRCSVCDGKGYRINIVEVRRVESLKRCPTCAGKGRFFSRAKTCPRCGGEGLGCSRCEDEGVVEGMVECDVCEGTCKSIVHTYEEVLIRQD
jgi:hypothetical protein